MAARSRHPVCGHPVPSAGSTPTPGPVSRPVPTPGSQHTRPRQPPGPVSRSVARTHLRLRAGPRPNPHQPGGDPGPGRPGRRPPPPRPSGAHAPGRRSAALWALGRGGCLPVLRRSIRAAAGACRDPSRGRCEGVRTRADGEERCEGARALRGGEEEREREEEKEREGEGESEEERERRDRERQRPSLNFGAFRTSHLGLAAARK